MTESAADILHGVLETDRARILSSLIRSCGGDFDLAEEALHDAVIAATLQWPQQGVPDAPDGWLLQAARYKAIDAIRRERRGREKLAGLRLEREEVTVEETAGPIPYDMLRLVFTCCHPALSEEARIALTLRTIVGMPTAEIARAFLVTEQTMAQRLVRAKKKIRDARIPYRVPERNDMAERLEAVLLVIYLLFNEGYSASSGAHLVRRELCAHAVHVGRVLVTLMPDEREITALLALMLLQDSRRDARTDAEGDLVLLADQDRALWDRARIDEGLALCAALEEASSPLGPYGLQAMIAAEHARAPSAAETDWKAIARRYAQLLRMRPTPVVALNHAVSVAMSEGPTEGLRLLDSLAEDLAGYGPFHAARADFLRKSRRRAEAEQSYLRAIALSTNAPERRFLEGRLREVRRGVSS